MGIGIGVLLGTCADFCRAGSGAEPGPFGVVGSGTGGSFSRRNGLGDVRTAAAAEVSRAVSGADAVGDALSKSGGAGAAGCAAIGAAGQMHAGDGCDRTGDAGAGHDAGREPGVRNCAGAADGRGGFRDRYTVAGAKDDSRDAFVLGDAVTVHDIYRLYSHDILHCVSHTLLPDRVRATARTRDRILPCIGRTGYPAGKSIRKAPAQKTRRRKVATIKTAIDTCRRPARWSLAGKPRRWPVVRCDGNNQPDP